MDGAHPVDRELELALEAGRLIRLRVAAAGYPKEAESRRHRHAVARRNGYRNYRQEFAQVTN